MRVRRLPHGRRGAGLFKMGVAIALSTLFFYFERASLCGRYESESASPSPEGRKCETRGVLSGRALS